jgi:nucleotide-binding universal stress UspA family protein
MRILLAMDGSASSDTARNLVASLAWPEASVIRLVAVVEPMSAVVAGLAPYSATEFDDRAVAASLEARLAESAASLAKAGRTVETLVLHGRPASAIVEEALEWRAELIVLGSRGLGRLRSMLLGSVSAEVVDHAPCPVLVARSSSIGPVLVAVDGSDSARRAVEHLADARYLAGHPVHVLTVGPLLHAGLPYWAMNVADSRAPAYQDLAAEDRRRTETQAARAAEELARDGYDVRWTIGGGDPAHEILEAAVNFGCDLIVMGSRGLTGLERIRLGSVARNVLLHASASVLIVREPIRERRPEAATGRVAQPALSPAG